jgi:thiol-disulfide isomerase/thioredoxin
LPAVFIIGGAIVIALIIAVVATRGSGDGPSTPQTAAVTITGALPAFSGNADPAVGMAAPTLEGRNFDGTAVAIRNDGRPKLVVFLAHWCPHCQAEVPMIVSWLDDNGKPADVDLYAVSTSVSRDRPNYPPSEWLAEANWPIPTIADTSDSRAATAYGLTGFPYFVAIDANGNVKHRVSGELTTAQLSQLIAIAQQ